MVHVTGIITPSQWVTIEEHYLVVHVARELSEIDEQQAREIVHTEWTRMIANVERRTALLRTTLDHS